MKRKCILSMTIVVAMVLSVIPTFNGTAYAEDVDSESAVASEEVITEDDSDTEEEYISDDETVVEAKGVNDTFAITPKTMVFDQPYESSMGGRIEVDYDYYTSDPFTIQPTSGNHIEWVESSNSNVVLIEQFPYEDYYYIRPNGVGTCTITCGDSSGNTDVCTVTVTSKWMCEYIPTYVNFDTNVAESGEYITGESLAGSTVSVVVAGRTYSAKAGTQSNEFDLASFSLRIPVVRIGSVITVVIRYNGGYTSYRFRVVKPEDAYAWLPNYVYRSTKKIKVETEYVHPGDKVIVKIGKKKYTKTITKNARRFVYTQKIKKPKKWGKKITITVKNKFGQVVSYETDKVFFGSKLKKRMTKKKCLCISGWEDPSERTVSGKYTIWWYDDDDDGYIDSYLKFKGNKLIGWHY